MNTMEELLEGKSSGSGLEIHEYCFISITKAIHFSKYITVPTGDLVQNNS
jgi:hypothetical protein